MSNNHENFYINGAWVKPLEAKTLDVINPATERAYTKISLGSAADVDRAVAAAKAAFPACSLTTCACRGRSAAGAGCASGVRAGGTGLGGPGSPGVPQQSARGTGVLLPTRQ